MVSETINVHMITATVEQIIAILTVDIVHSGLTVNVIGLSEIMVKLNFEIH